MKVIELKYNGSVERIFIPLKEEQSSIEGYLLTVTSCRIRSNAWVNPTKYEYLTPCSFNVIAKIKIFKGGKSTWKFENEFNFENPFIDNDKNMLNMSFIHKLSVDKLGYEKYQNMFLDEEDIIYNKIKKSKVLDDYEIVETDYNLDKNKEIYVNINKLMEA